MKTRIVKLLGIGLTLVIVASMFAVGVPVSAANTKAFEFTIPLLGSPSVGSMANWEINYLGSPVEVTLPYLGSPITKTLDGNLKYQSLIDKNGEAVYTYNLDPSGSFGAGVGKLYFETIYDNFTSLRRLTTGHWVFTFFEDDDEWEGTITCSRLTKHSIIGWSSAALTNTNIKYESLQVHWGMLGGTGDFANFRFVTNTYGASGGGSVFGTGFFAPIK